MYTVIRFTSILVEREDHERIGNQLNVLIPGSYQGIRRAGDGFSAEVAEDGSWREHRVAILNFIHAGWAAIIGARQVGIDVCVDIAIEPEDLAGIPVFVLHADPELIRSLAEADVSLECSVYGAGG
jgi:hypothetical protein